VKFSVDHDGFYKKEKRSKKERKFGRGGPIETAAAEEIEIGCLRQLLLDDFHKLLG
jgi:hypothetical protein